MALFDTHCHLNFEIFTSDVDQVVTRAQAAGVAEMVVVGTTLDNSRLAATIATRHQGVYAAVGVHPHTLFSYLEQPMDTTRADIQRELEALVQQPSVVAIGEIGFDRWHYPGSRYQDYRVSERFLTLQRLVFLTQLEVAYGAQLPVILHNRLAAADLLLTIEEWWSADRSRPEFLVGKAVFHCCEPDWQLLAFAQQHHFFIGIAGNVTTDEAIAAFAQRVPSELLVIETDAPFFKPRASKQGAQASPQAKHTRCEPSDILKIAQRLAEIRGETVEAMIEQSTRNARHFFGV